MAVAAAMYAHNAPAAVTATNGVYQASNGIDPTSTIFNYSITNNSGVTLDSFSLDLGAIQGESTDFITQTTALNTRSDVYEQLGINIGLDFQNGWDGFIASNGTLTFTNNGGFPGFDYNTFDSGDTFNFSLNAGDLYDTNGDNYLSGEELQRVSDLLAEDSITATFGATGITTGDANRIVPTPEPSTAFLGGLGALLLLRRRR